MLDSEPEGFSYGSLIVSQISEHIFMPGIITIINIATLYHTIVAAVSAVSTLIYSK